MTKDSEPILVFTNVPDQATAEHLARGLLEERLAAAVNIVPDVRSLYRWQGRIELGTEQQLVIKTQRGCYAAVEMLIAREHPYELPAVLCVPIASGLPAYLQWITDSVDSPS